MRILTTNVSVSNIKFAVLCFFLILGNAAVAATSEKPISAPLIAGPEEVDFLINSAAKDFKASGPDLPTAIRNAKVGFLRAPTKGNYLLCGSFKSGTGAEAKWIPFATIKTSDYEQWVGGTAVAFCRQKDIKWYPGNHSEMLLKKLSE